MALFAKLFNINDLILALPNILYTNLKSPICIESVCLDSRITTSNSMFICYKGPNNDGHDYIEQTVLRGTKCIVVERFDEEIQNLVKKLEVAVIHVANIMDFMSDLAKYKRSLMAKTRFIAITGSVGKTTTKNLIATCLGKFFEVESSYKSYNNFFGVTLTLINLSLTCDIAIVEIGTNHVGEIEPLAKLVNPDITIITGVGIAHLGNFPNGITDIIKEKASICSGLQPGGIVILNEENQYFEDIRQEVVKLGVKNIVRIGKKDSSHLYLGTCSLNDYYINFKVITKSATPQIANCSINGIVVHNAFNSLFAFAVAKLFKVNIEDAVKSISSFEIVEGRGNIEYLYVNKKKITVINDTHNCSFEALKAALETMGVFKNTYPDRRTVCFLGDIAELGDHMSLYHEKMSEFILINKIDKVYCVGEGMKYLFNVLPEHIKGEHFKHIGGLIKVIRSKIEDQDICLFKGKRTLTMEKAIIKLYMA